LFGFPGHIKVVFTLYCSLLRVQQHSVYKETKNSVALVRKRTIPTERPPIVGEVTDNFCG
jgi:hypothetical protein